MVENKPQWSQLSNREKAAAIIQERTPSVDQVIYSPTVQFLDSQGVMTREERARTIALGDRTAISYDNLSQKVIADRGVQVADQSGEATDVTASFFQQYTLAARTTREIAHTSILEQVNPGPEEFGGDPPIVLEGISMLSALRDICGERHAGFEAFSSRGGVLPPNYWHIPEQLVSAGLESTLQAGNEEVYGAYLEIAEKSIEYFLGTTQQREGEKLWQYRWRVLSYSLDVARQVLNGTFLNHFAMHANSALALRESVVRLASSELPETQMLADNLRELANAGLPTLMRHTDSSPYHRGLRRVKSDLTDWHIKPDPGYLASHTKSQFESATLLGDAATTFLAAFIANNGDVSYSWALSQARQMPQNKVEEAMNYIFSGMAFHDKPPAEIEMVQMTSQYWLTVGAFYELLRHRPATFIRGKFTPIHGHVVPDVIQQIGMEETYKRALDRNFRSYSIVMNLGRNYEVLAPYYVSRADIIPVAVRMSGLDAFHILKIRANEAAHPDISGPMYELEIYLKNTAGAIFNHLVKK